jgi:hypothetical protein
VCSSDLTLGEVVEDILIEDELLAAEFATVIEHVEIGGATGPGCEARALLEILRLAPEGEVGFLQDVFRKGVVVTELDDVAEHGRLRPGEQFDEFLGVTLHGQVETARRGVNLTGFLNPHSAFTPSSPKGTS